ncbi:MAG: putative 4-hydroxybenzoate polyprenyltransferase [Acidobacteriaceae bacterium]|nr:putative 4-hydroxybenzoate polyprenyltransferase [Acidobacteriaceae bacterium]
MESVLRNTRVTLEMIKWEHSIFALPFALTATVLAAGGWPSLPKLCWIVWCMVMARSAAMGFNRWADAEIDAKNPRTKMRAIPAGQLSRGFVLAFTLVAAGLFIAGAAMLNHLTLLLSPVALLVVLAYSYMKRVTRWSHLVLGLALGIAPAAAWIAVRGSLDLRIVLLTAIVLLWVGGFDVLYACQDYEHDVRVGLNSIPAAFGLNGAFWIARIMHLTMAVLLFVFLHLFGLGTIALGGMCAVVLLLVYEHAIISPSDLRRMNAAFFTLNGVISMVFFASIAVDLLMHRG